MPRKLSLVTLLCWSCGSHPAAPVPPTVSAPGAGASVPAPPSDELDKSARFADLVQRASQLEGTARDTKACVLLETPGGYRLRSELSSGVRPLPAPPHDFDEALKNVEQVELLSAWGRYGDGSGKLALAGFTRSASTRDAYALLLGDRGIALRAPSGQASGAPPREQGLDVPGALAALSARDPSHSANVFVAAEADVPLGALHQLLQALAQQGFQATLAVSLAPNTPVPLPASITTKLHRCPDGLSATAAAEGSLPTAELLAGLATLKERAPDCLESGDARGAAGGKLTLAFRIAASGRVEEACIARAELSDPAVLACVSELASQLTFAAPSPSGVVDVELPIVLKGSPQPAQRALCTPSDS